MDQKNFHVHDLMAVLFTVFTSGMCPQIDKAFIMFFSSKHDYKSLVIIAEILA